MTNSPSDDEVVLPLTQEYATVSKAVVEAGRVQISTRVEAREETIRESLRHEDVVVNRVPVNRIVEVAPGIRQEGDTVIYPVVEETLVIEKRLLLKEEVHITCKSRLEPVDQQVTLRTVHADVQRTPASLPSEN